MPQLQPQQQQGFSLPEIMISLSLGLILLAVSAQVLISSVKMNRIAQQQLDMQYTAQVVKNNLTSDLHRAGFYTAFLNQNDIGGTASHTPFQPHCKGGDEHFAHMLFPKIYGVNGGTGDFVCLEKHIAGSDVLMIKFLQQVAEVDTRSTAQHQLYLRANLENAKLFKAKDRSNIRNQLNSNESNREILFQVHSRMYYVRDTGRSCNKQAIAGLYREYSNHHSQMMAEEIASGIEQLQFQYWINDSKKHAHEIALHEWPKVSAVSVDLLLVSECEEVVNHAPRRFELADISVTEESPVRKQRAHFRFDIALRN